MYNVLWLASWYPNEIDAFTGDFIERHAIAVSRYVKLSVLVILKDESLRANKTKIKKTAESNLTVYRVYYGKTNMPVSIESIWSAKRYFKLQKQLYHQIEKETGRPDIVHVHVAMKAGILALHLKKKYQLPYVVTEHWTGYYPQSIPSIYDNNFFYRRINKKVLQKASLFLPVTRDLGETIHENFNPVAYTVIPNVVNTSLFFYQQFESPKFRFIHPSLMGYQKNPEGILQACFLLKNKGYDFELLMIGNEDQELINKAAEINLLNKVVFFKPAVPYSTIAREMQQSSALLLFSRFENLPCVILEALCCGLPVISSQVGGVSEVVNDTNGILVENENVEQLAVAMCTLIDTYALYNRETIANTASDKFNYDTVAKQYLNQYKKVIDTPFIN